MPSAVERFVERAVTLGVRPEVQEFPDGTRTAIDAANAVGCEVGAIVKSLVFVADERPVLVLTSGAHRVDEVRLAAFLGAGSVRKADADEVRSATGYAIGGTPPFGHDTELPVLIDPALLTHALVWAAAGTPRTVFPLAPDALVRASGAREADVAS